MADEYPKKGNVLTAVLVSIVILAGIVMIYNSKDLIGEAIAGTYSCTETDGGYYPFQKGITTQVFYPEITPMPTANAVATSTTTSKTDVCVDDRVLTEYYCSAKRIASNISYCVNGCSDGACKKNYCGNQILEPGEECEPRLTSTTNCTLLDNGTWTSGTAICDSTCKFGRSSCSQCGNGILNNGEQCDGTDLNGQTCISRGFTGGTLGCYPFGSSSQCKFNIANCLNQTKLCKDTDGGINIFVKGNATRPQYTTYIDECIYDDINRKFIIHEAICDVNDFPNFTWDICPGSCYNGACIL